MGSWGVGRTVARRARARTGAQHMSKDVGRAREGGGTPIRRRPGRAVGWAAALVAALAGAAALSSCQQPIASDISKAMSASLPATSESTVDAASSARALNDTSDPPAATPSAPPEAVVSTKTTPTDESATEIPRTTAGRPAEPPRLEPIQLIPTRPEWGRLDTTVEAAAVDKGLRSFLTHVDQAKVASSATEADLDDFSSGPALEEIENSLVEMGLEGYRQRGTVTVRALSVYAVKAPAERLLVACLDDSNVEVVASDGYVVRPASKTPRGTLHEYTVQRVAGSWRVLKHDMPVNPDCGRR